VFQGSVIKGQALYV